MTYKYGNWYCKPANESEAREIVERAVASGAEIYETVGLSHGDHEYEWDLLDVWGVLKGRTFTGDTDCGGSFVCATEYTITQVRQKFPLPDEQTKWNGEGWPPVGCDYEFSANGVHWEERIMLFKDDISFLTASKKFPASRWHYKVNDPDLKFRPLRSERDRWVEAAIYTVGGKQAIISAENVFGKIYDALKSGDLKAPEVER